MPVRTAFPGGATSVPGHILTASDVNSLPGGWTGYAEVTAGHDRYYGAIGDGDGQYFSAD